MPSSRSLVGALVAALALTLVAGASAAAARTSPAALAPAGSSSCFRHAATDFSKPDQDPVVVSDCSTQRNLSAQGRADARAIGRGVRRLGLPVGKVFSSAYCRTLETARLAFGRATVQPALLNTIAAEHDDAWRAQIRDARRLFGTKPAAGKLTVLVTHGVVVAGDDGADARGGRGDRLPAARQQPLPRRRPRDAAGVGDAPPTGLDGRRRPARPGVPGARRARTRTTWRVAPDGTVWYTAQHTGKLGPARPEDGPDDGDPARGRLGAARRHRRARRRRVGDRRRAQRDRPGRPEYVRLPRLPAARLDRHTRTSTPRPSTSGASSGSRARTGSTGG